MQVVRFRLPMLAEHAFGIAQMPASLWDKCLSFLLIVWHSVQGWESPEAPDLSLLSIKILMAAQRHCRRRILLFLKLPNSSVTYVHINLASGFEKHFILSLQQHSRRNICVFSSLIDWFQQVPTATVGEDSLA